MTFEELKEKYKDGWWEGHDGYTGDDMFSDIQYLFFVIGDMQTVIDTYEEALQQIVDIGNKTFKTESEVIAGKVLKFYEE